MSEILKKGKKIVNWHKNRGFSVFFKGKWCNYCMCLKSRIFSAHIFIGDCLSPLYWALYFQGLCWQKQ